jgi:hypothetical protein
MCRPQRPRPAGTRWACLPRTAMAATHGFAASGSESRRPPRRNVAVGDRDWRLIVVDGAISGELTELGRYAKLRVRRWPGDSRLVRHPADRLHAETRATLSSGRSCWPCGPGRNRPFFNRGRVLSAALSIIHEFKVVLMNCYVCDDRGEARPAVAICEHCFVALCREHLDADLTSALRSGRVHGRGCTHHPKARARPTGLRGPAASIRPL